MAARKDSNVVERRIEGGGTAKEIAEEVEGRPRLLPEVLAALESANKRVKNAAIKVLAIVSETRPELLYPEVDRFVGCLNSPSNVLKWNAADIVANLARVDEDGKIGRDVVSAFFGFLDDESMVTAGHAVDNLWKFALVRPRLAGKTARQLLRAPTVPRDAECQRILAAKAIASLDRFADRLDDPKEIVAFVRRELQGDHPRTRAKAARLLKRLGG